MKIIEQRERLLHQHEVRTNRKQLENLLHPDFIEIGYSGPTWDYTSVIESCLGEKSPDYIIYSESFNHITLREDLIQLFYEECHKYKDGKIGKKCKRMSLWENIQGIWKLRYHQATPFCTYS